MTWIIFTIIFALLFLGSLAARAALRAHREKLLEQLASPQPPDRSDTEQEANGARIGAAVATGVASSLLGLWLLATVMASMHTVKAGHVGVVYQFGAIVDQTSDSGDGGLVIVPPWRDVKQANVQVQKHSFTGLGAASEETQDVWFDVTLNYSLSPRAVQRLYENVGPDYFDKLVNSRINQYFKDETVQYSAVEITTKRDEIREAVQKRLQDDLSAYSITVNALLIDNITYNDGFNQAIEAKEIARQNAIEEQNKVAGAEARAKQREAEALGEANSLRIKAQGQADANALLTKSLTPELIQYEAVQRLSDNITVALVPSGSGLLIDPSQLVGAASK